MFKPCIIIPVYKHAEALSCFAEKLEKPLIIVDDGNAPQDAELLKKIAANTGAKLVRLDSNMGKGAAMKAGFRAAIDAGFSHALQMDADGQHDPAAAEAFFMKAEAHPAALINSYPVYDQTVPVARKFFRKFTNFWVKLETGRHIADGMCGFRVYPLGEVADLLNSLHSCGMGYDTEILVKFAWLGTEIIDMPVGVTYPEGGHSNFRLFSDNIKLSLLHTRLCLSKIFGRTGRKNG
jgi:glycosyltransferase involved in cell wall biosynthesis